MRDHYRHLYPKIEADAEGRRRKATKDHNNTITSKKRIEAINIRKQIQHLPESMNIQTFYESKGMGKGEKYLISYGKGGKTTKMPYSTRHTVVTIIDENKVGEVINAIRQSAMIASKSNVGIIVISSVEDVLPI
jgi:nitrogen regulatory protein PII